MALQNMESAFEIMQDAALDPTTWRQALDRISRAVGATGALLMRVPAHAEDIRSASLDDCLNFYYKNELHKADIRVKRGFAKSLRAGIVVDQDFITEEEVRREPYYQEFMRPFGGRWFAGLTARIGDSTFALSIQRTFAEGPFIPAEQERLLLLRHKLIESVMIGRAAAKARADGYLDGLQLFDQPAALINAARRVVAVNNALRELLGPGLRITNNRFHCIDSVAQQVFDRAVAMATSFDPRAVHAIGRANLPYGENKSLKVTVIPYTFGSLPYLDGARAVALFSDPSVRRVPTMEALIATYGLTPAEARLTVALVRTSDMKSAAEACGLTWGSARQYMSSVFAKTGTSGQVELVSLLSAATGPQA
jgi:DNA-binding CsgD family transcriptional regulator